MWLFMKVTLVSFLTFVLFIFEVVVHHFSHSLALLVLANQSIYHFLFFLIVGMSLALSNNNSRTLNLKATYGWRRLSIIGTFVSLIALTSLCFGTLIETIQTLSHINHLDAPHLPVYTCVLGGAHFLVWCVAFRLLGGYTYGHRMTVQPNSLEGHEKSVEVAAKQAFVGDMNAYDLDVYGCTKVGEECYRSLPDRGGRPLLHRTTSARQVRRKGRSLKVRHTDVLRDLIPCFCLVISSVVIYLLNWYKHQMVSLYVDPLMALISTLFLTMTSMPILLTAGQILLQGLPSEWTYQDSILKISEELRSKFLRQVLDVHEVHIWSLVPDKIVATLHIVFKDETSYLSSISSIEDFLRGEGIQQLTLQPEFPSPSNSEGVLVEKGGEVAKAPSCLLKCSNQACKKSMCCGFTR